jgi:hypothetical protein
MPKRQSAWKVIAWSAVIAVLFLYFTSATGFDSWMSKAY